MDSKELVSIIIPCYNHENYIDDCLKSLCEQTYSPMEIIICDDCSSDRSFEKLIEWQERLQMRFVAVHILQNENNLGVVKNANRMLKYCRGKYVKLLASDDMLLPDAIENLVSYLEASNADIVYSNIIEVRNTFHYDEVESVLHDKKPRYSGPQPSGKGLTGQICCYNFIAAPSVMVPYATYQKYGFYDEAHISEDYEFWLRVSTTGSIEYLNKITTLYRVSDSAMSHFDMTEQGRNRFRCMYKDGLKIFKKYENYCTKEQKEYLYNQRLEIAIGIIDRESIRDTLEIMRQEEVPISWGNQMKYLLVRIRVYQHLKRIKYWIKCVIKGEQN